MIGYNLKKSYRSLFELGLVRSKRQFSRDYLSRGWSYLREFEQRDRDGTAVSRATISALRTRLREVARLVPPQIAIEVEHIIREIDRDAQIMAMLRRSL